MELKDTTKLMISSNYKDRFVAEYQQTKIRCEKLNYFCNRIEVQDITGIIVEHDCPYEMLREQQEVMKEYLHKLELRAIVEEIDLENPEYNKEETTIPPQPKVVIVKKPNAPTKDNE